MGIVLAALALGASGSYAQNEESAATSSLSRPMRTAVMFYERGEDLQAMDRFMDILTKGDPAERSMANEYINLITHRMNSGGADFKPAPLPPRAPGTIAPPGAATPVDEPPARRPDPAQPVEAPLRTSAPQVVIEAENVASVSPRSLRPLPTAPIRPAPARSDAPLPPANKALMKKEIKAKIRSALEKSLRELKAVEDVRVIMQENGDPRAIGIPSPLLFSSGIAFQKSAGKLLDSLIRLVYSLGSTKVMILPEGAAIGDAKVLDMRRTMGVSAQFFSAGIAPPRVKVNLLNNQVEIPKVLQDFKGVVLLFVYNEPLGLVVESALGDEAGPPLSLGVYPPSFRPDRSEGVIIELSVSDPPAGLVSWKFQLLQPSGAGGDLTPLQEVMGGGPVFHQIYWNGRQNYFGALLPAGRYECVLTATDTKNRQRTLHKWIQLMEDGTVAAAPAAPAPAAAANPTAGTTVAAVAPSGKRQAPSADLDGPVKAASLVKPVSPKAAKGVQIGAKSKKRRGARGKKSKVAVESEEPAQEQAAAPNSPAAPAPAAAPAASAAALPSPATKPSKPTSGNYELIFNKGTHQLAPEGEKMMAKVAETVSYYPLEHLKLIGYAHPAEPDAAALAERRAQMVAGLLINKYQVEPKKLQVSSKVGEEYSARVEVFFVGNE